MVDKQAVEVAGRNWLTAELLLRDFQVAIPEVDRGIDLLVFREVGEQGIRALPLQLKCSSGESFTMDRKYEGRGIPLAFVWTVLREPSAYFLTFEEALAVLGERAIASPSWIERGRYDVTSIGKERRALLEPYRDRWDWLAQRLEAQPESGL